MTPQRPRVRFAVGIALAAALGAWLAHGFASDARRELAAAAQTRLATVDLQALTALAQEPDAAALAREWQAGTPGVAQVRVVHGMQLEVSTAPSDTAPRRLAREEKPLFDRAQRIASAVQTNRDEQAARKAELEVERLPGQRLSIAGPLEIGGAPAGVVELVTTPLPAPPSTPWLPFALAVLGSVAVFVAAARLIGPRRPWLAVAAIACLGAGQLAMLRVCNAALDGDVRAASAQVGVRVHEQSTLLQRVSQAHGLTAPAPELDVDLFRQPRGLVSAAGEVDTGKLASALAVDLHELRRALLVAFGLSLALVLAAGLGLFNAIGSTLKRNRQAYLYIAPAILGMLVLVFYPFSYGITLSFTDSNIYNTSAPISDLWIGLRNYVAILGDFSIRKQTEGGFVFNYQNFYWTLMVTVVWTITNVTIGVSSGLVLALILNTRDLALRPIYRVLLILPWATPNYITALIWKGMFHQQFGVINQVLQMAGLAPLNWFDRPFTSFLTALATNGWLSFPFMMVVSLGALQSIPADLYEAARVDGATRWQQFRAITLPSLRPALVPAVILSVVWTFNMFNIIYLVTAGEPGGATEILVTQAYKFAFERYRYGYAAAYSTVIFMILLVYGVFQNRVSKGTEA